MTHIRQRRSTAAQWTAANPVLQEGEVGWETDTRKQKLGNGSTAWNALPYVAYPFSATKADVGLDQVDNTSDADKPISTATQVALDAHTTSLAGKAPVASPVFTGNPTAPTPAAGDNDTSLATTAFVQTINALSRAKKWSSAVLYITGDVVGYAGGLYRATGTPTLALPPALHLAAWEPVIPYSEGWAQIDPYFTSDDLSAWDFSAVSGTVNSLAYTTTAGEFDTGKRALKIDLAAASSQRFYSKTENIVKGGESVQVQIRAKMITGTAGQATLTTALMQNDQTGTPDFGSTGVASSVPIEGTPVLTTSWQNFTFTHTAQNGKPRARVNVIVADGTGGAVVVIDYVKVVRRAAAGRKIWVRKSVTESVTSSTTRQADDELWFAFGAGETIEFEFHALLFAATSSIDASVGLVATGTLATINYSFIGLSQAVASGNVGEGNFIGSSSPTGGNTTVGVSSAASGTPVLIKGNLVATTAGVLTLHWAQAASSASALQMLAGSSVKAERVA